MFYLKKNINKLFIIIVGVINFFLSGSIFSEELFKNFKKYKKTDTKFKLEKISNGFNYPWGMTFIDKKNLLITEKSGKLIKVNTQTGTKTEIFHEIKSIPYSSNLLASQQGGLMDVLYHEGLVYFSYSHNFDEITKKNNNEASTAIARGELIKNKIKNLEILLIGKPKLKINKHWGSRLVIKNNQLFASFGERGQGMIAQDPTKHPGSIVRINIDGSIPHDNPRYRDKRDWLPEIYVIGVRNPQGMAMSNNDKIYFSQHGPKGGDNIGLVEYGANFGWKEVAWGGTEYNGFKIGKVPFKKKFKKPIASWVPSMGISNFKFYDGEVFPNWKGDMILSSTASKSLFRLKFKNEKIIKEEILIQKKIGRIRDLEIDKKGNIFLIIDEKNSPLWKLSK